MKNTRGSDNWQVDSFRGWVSFIIGFNFLFYPVFVYLLHRGGHLISRHKSKLKLTPFSHVTLPNWPLVLKPIKKLNLYYLSYLIFFVISYMDY